MYVIIVDLLGEKIKNDYNFLYFFSRHLLMFFKCFKNNIKKKFIINERKNKVFTFYYRDTKIICNFNIKNRLKLK